MPTNLGQPVDPPGGNNNYNPWHDYDTTTMDISADYADDAMGDPTSDEGQVSAMDLNRVAGTVGGMVKDTGNWDTEIAEIADPLEEETNQFIDAYDDGYTKQTKADPWSGGWSSEGTQKEAGTMAAARTAKRDDRKQDREARQAMREDMEKDLKQKYLDQDMKPGEAKRKARRESRRAKRAMRQGQTAQRKDAWETFKGDVDISKGEDAAAYENYYEQQ